MLFAICFSSTKDDNEIEFFNTIVVQPHLKLVTDLGRGYHVRCRYKSREASVASSSPESAQQTGGDGVKGERLVVDRRAYGRSLGISAVDNQIPMPACHMKIFSGDKVAENVKIGDPLKLKIYIDKQQMYGLHVMHCAVRDGLGWSEQNLVQIG